MILLKNKRIEDLENLLNEKSLANSKNSLKDELDVVSCVHCEKCGKFFNSSKELKIHIDTDHKQNVVRSFLQTKLRILEIDLSKQRTKLTSSLLKLREKEILDNERCSCIGFCHINHRKHNFYKSKAKDVLDHLAKVQAAETMVDGQTLKNKENTAGIKTRKKAPRKQGKDQKNETEQSKLIVKDNPVLQYSSDEANDESESTELNVDTPDETNDTSASGQSEGQLIMSSSFEEGDNSGVEEV